MECARLMFTSLLRCFCWLWWFFQFNYQLTFKKFFAIWKTDSFWSFLSESLENPKLLIWMLSSFRRGSKVFISSSSKLVSSNCPFWSAKLDVLICIFLVICMGLQKCLFFLLFSLTYKFYAMCSMAENPVLIGEKQVKKNFLPFSTSPVSERTTGPLFLLRCCTVGTRIENVLDYVYRVLPKKFRLSLLYVYSGKNIIILLPFITIFLSKTTQTCVKRKHF